MQSKRCRDEWSQWWVTLELSSQESDMMTFVMRTPGAQDSPTLIPRASEFGGGKRSGTLSGWSWGPARPFWDRRSYSDEKQNPTATQRRVTSLDAYVDSTSNRKTASCRESHSSSSKQLLSPKTLPFGPRRTGTLGQIPYQGLNLVPLWGFRKYQLGWLLFRSCEVYAVLFFLCYA